MSTNKSFLGTGWSFPPTFSETKKQIKMVSEAEDIEQSLNLLLSTMPGERLTNPNYGCDLHNLMFENIDGTSKFLMEDAIKRAVLYYEPRINLDEINIDTSKELDGVVYISLFYTIRKVNIRSNIVYPFYKLEGTLVDED